MLAGNKAEPAHGMWLPANPRSCTCQQEAAPCQHMWLLGQLGMAHYTARPVQPCSLLACAAPRTAGSHVLLDRLYLLWAMSNQRGCHYHLSCYPAAPHSQLLHHQLTVTSPSLPDARSSEAGRGRASGGRGNQAVPQVAAAAQPEAVRAGQGQGLPADRVGSTAHAALGGGIGCRQGLAPCRAQKEHPGSTRYNWWASTCRLDPISWKGRSSLWAVFCPPLS